MHHWKFCKKYRIFLRKCTLCKTYRRFNPTNIAPYSKYYYPVHIVHITGGWGWRGVICDKKELCCRFCWLFWWEKITNFRKKGGGTLIQNILLPILVTPEKDQHCFPKQRGWGGGEGLRGCLEAFLLSEFSSKLRKVDVPFPATASSELSLAC